MKRAIAKEWLWLLSMLIIGAIVGPLILYGFSTYHFDYYLLNTKDELPVLPPKSTLETLIYDSVATSFNNHAIYDALSSAYDIKSVGTFDEFLKRMKSPKNRDLVFQELTGPDFSGQEILQAVRINEPGYNVFFAHLERTTHYLVVLAPYFVCLFCRFTYWSARTTLAKTMKV